MTEYYSALGAAQAPIILGQYSLGLQKQLWIITRSDGYNRVCDRVQWRGCNRLGLRARLPGGLACPDRFATILGSPTRAFQTF